MLAGGVCERLGEEGACRRGRAPAAGQVIGDPPGGAKHGARVREAVLGTAVDEAFQSARARVISPANAVTWSMETWGSRTPWQTSTLTVTEPASAGLLVAKLP